MTLFEIETGEVVNYGFLDKPTMVKTISRVLYKAGFIWCLSKEKAEIVVENSDTGSKTRVHSGLVECFYVDDSTGIPKSYQIFRSDVLLTSLKKILTSP
jgi:hypothetical protein